MHMTQAAQQQGSFVRPTGLDMTALVSNSYNQTFQGGAPRAREVSRFYYPRG